VLAERPSGAGCAPAVVQGAAGLAWWSRVFNPLRSEGDAFRLLLYVIAFFVVVIAVVLIARAV
jgi:hypothetical protein